MPIIYHEGEDLLSSPAHCLVNTVNCVGVMGKGLALQFKQRYGARLMDRYVEVCKAGLLKPGVLQWSPQSDGHLICNFPTKVDWRNPSRLLWVQDGLTKFVASYEQRGITSVAFPPLGCGNGGLDWEEVGTMMTHFLRALPIEVHIYIPHDWWPFA